MKTLIVRIPEDLHRECKIKSATIGIPLQTVLLYALEAFVRDDKPQTPTTTTTTKKGKR